MSIHKAGVVDSVVIEKGTGDIVLVVVDDEDWNDENKHIELLQQKLNAYLAFMESGEVYEYLASELGHSVEPSIPVKVGILAKYPLSPRASSFLEYAKAMFEGAGFSLAHKVLRVPAT